MTDPLRVRTYSPRASTGPSRSHRIARSTAAVGGALVLVLAVGACGPVNAGSSAASSFEDWMSTDPNVAEVSASGTNDLPFSGTAGGVVTLVPDLSPDEVAAVVERAVTFESRTSVSVSIDYPAGDFLASYPVSRTDRAYNAGLDAFVRALDAGTDATTVELEVGLDESAIVATGPGDVLEGFTEVRAVAADHEPWASAATEFASTDGWFSISAAAGSDAAAARRVLSTVAAAYPVIGAHLSDEAVEVRIDGARTPDVAALAATVAGTTAVTVQFGTVTRIGEGNFTAAELVTSTAFGAATVVSAVERSSRVSIVVPDLESALRVDAAVGALPDSGVELSLATEDGSVTLTPLAHGYSPYVATLTALDALRPSVTSVEVDGRRIRVVASRDTDLVDLGAALALAPRSVPLVSIQLGGDDTWEITPASALAASSVTVIRGGSGSDALVDALVTGWNTAR